MTVKTLRQIVKIDEEKCNGCGACVTSCAEGALRIVGGKAKLVSESYCDGLGACLGKRPQGAITIEERKALEFDEKAVKHASEDKEHESLPCGCPGATVTQIEHKENTASKDVSHQSMLSNFPFQLALVPPSAPFLKKADLLLTADCVPFTYGGFHEDFLNGHILLVACPKLDDYESHLKKLTAILREAKPKSLTVLHMEVPCCSGLTFMAKEALRLSGGDIPLEDITIGIRGNVKA